MTFEAYKEKYGIRLDEAQDAACRLTDGHILLLAVPGSGKTTVMISRLGYLVYGLSADPSSLLAVTYSVAAANEMMVRYERLFGTRDVEIRTIHGLCASLLYHYQKMKGTEPFRLLDKESEVSSIVRSILLSHGSHYAENDIRDIKTALTFCRNNMMTDDEIEKKVHVDGHDFLPIYRAYRAYKREHRLMDYDDQLCYGYEVLNRYPAMCRWFAGQYAYLCVDEAQDTSKIQHMIIRKLTETIGNLFMVGDEDQSIYGFRAAYPDGLMEFDRVYPDAKVLFIEKNYRSTKTIIAAADRFIAKNQNRRQKHMVTDNEIGAPIVHTELPDIRYMSAYLKKQIENRPSGETIAILARLNDSLLPLFDLLWSEGISCRLRGNDGLFFTHYIVTDMLSFIDFANHPCDLLLWEKLYYKCSTGMKRADYECAMRQIDRNDSRSLPEQMADCCYLRESMRRRLKCIASALKRIPRVDTAASFRLVLHDCGYGSYLAYRTGDLTKVNAMLAIAERYPKHDDFRHRLDELQKALKAGSEDGFVYLSTIHSAKGMEFDRVILCDARDGILPSITRPANRRFYTEEELRQMEEDRRIFYVGVTRAKKYLELLTYRRAFGDEVEGFRYVDEVFDKKKEPVTDEKKAVGSVPINDTLTVKTKAVVTDAMLRSFTVGSTVYHEKFGEGIIIGRRGDRIEVSFSGARLPKRLDLMTCLENRIIHIR